MESQIKYKNLIKQVVLPVITNYYSLKIYIWIFIQKTIYNFIL
jgi:hypothetical protein